MRKPITGITFVSAGHMGAKTSSTIRQRRNRKASKLVIVKTKTFASYRQRALRTTRRRISVSLQNGCSRLCRARQKRSRLTRNHLLKRRIRLLDRQINRIQSYPAPLPAGHRLYRNGAPTTQLCQRRVLSITLLDALSRILSLLKTISPLLQPNCALDQDLGLRPLENLEATVGHLQRSVLPTFSLTTRKEAMGKRDAFELIDRTGMAAMT
jgi:hypothetical protein